MQRNRRPYLVKLSIYAVVQVAHNMIHISRAPNGVRVTT